MAGPKQHVELYRKLLLRRALLPGAAEGAVYLPFCGDGDIAVKLYKDHSIYAAGLDPKRAAVCRSRLPGARIRIADCEHWPFCDAKEPFAVADFDAYVHPYASLLAFWAEAPKAQRLALFFTDGHRQGIKRAGVLFHPDGIREELAFRAFHIIYSVWKEPWEKQRRHPTA